jgi:hypothetical protein
MKRKEKDRDASWPSRSTFGTGTAGGHLVQGAAASLALARPPSTAIPRRMQSTVPGVPQWLVRAGNTGRESGEACGRV